MSFVSSKSPRETFEQARQLQDLLTQPRQTINPLISAEAARLARVSNLSALARAKRSLFGIDAGEGSALPETLTCDVVKDLIGTVQAAFTGSAIDAADFTSWHSDVQRKLIAAGAIVH